MNSALLGLIAATAWGFHDFIGRFASRATGQLVTTLGLSLSGFIILTIYAWIYGIAFPSDATGLWLCATAGITYALATLCLFSAYRIGSMSIVSPIAGSYPAIAVVFGLVTGSRPSLNAWLAIAAVIGGTLLVSYVGKSHEQSGHIQKGKLLQVLAFAIATAVFFAASLIAGQVAAPTTGEFEVTWLARVFAIAAVMPFFAFKSMHGKAPLKWWPALILMGLLDTIAMFSVFAAGKYVMPEMAIVIGGSFGAIVTLLAWIILKEPVNRLQWLGIALICCGAAILSAGW